MEERNILGTEPVGKLLVKMSLPAISAQVINTVYHVVDRMFIGRLPEVGSLSLAAVGIALPLIMLIAAFASLVGMGGAPRATIALGAGDRKKAEQILGNAAALMVLFSLILAVLFFWFQDSLLTLFGATENILPFAKEYLSLYLLGTLSIQISLGLNLFISAQGFAKTSMITVLIAAIANMILDPLFIYGLGLGIRGAALATATAQTLSALWVLRFLTGEKTMLRLRRENLRLDRRVILPMIALGAAPFLIQASESLVQLSFYSGMKRYGGPQADQLTGVMSILLSAMQLVVLPLVGLSQGAQPILSYNYGAKKMDRVKKAFSLLLAVSAGFSTALWLLLELFPHFFAGLFTADPALLELAQPMLRLFMAGIFAMGVQTACQQTFVSLGQAKISLVPALLRKVILLIPLALILPIYWGVGGILTAEPVADLISAAVTGVLFWGFLKRKLQRS